KADRLEAEARSRAQMLDSETAERRQQLFGELEKQRDKLNSDVENLRSFEREYRSRLKSYFTQQLEALEGGGGETSRVVMFGRAEFESLSVSGYPPVDTVAPATMAPGSREGPSSWLAAPGS